MLNHAYTLLLNAPPPAAGDYGPAEEVADPAYAGVPLPAALRPPYELLFGSASDRVGRAVTLARLLQVCRTRAALWDLLRADDPRLALLGPRPARAAQVTGPAPAALTLPPPVFGDPGRGFGAWLVEAGGDVPAGSARVTPAGVAPALVPATDDGAGATRVGLVGSRAALHVGAAAGTWTVAVWEDPGWDPSGFLAADPGTLFRPGLDATEDALYALWRSTDPGWERVAAGALALARRLAEVGT